MDAFLLIVRLFIAALLAIAGIGKLLDTASAKKVMKDFGVPSALAAPAYLALSLLEIVLAVLLLFTSTSWVGAIGALILMLVFIGGMLWQMSRGHAPDCHCFGQLHSEPVSRKSVFRNVIFAAVSLVLVAAGPARQGLGFSDPPIGAVVPGLAVLALMAVCANFLFLRQISQRQAEILRRLDLLEAFGGRGVERQQAGNPHDSLPIGALFPDFDLPAVSGGRETLGSILSSGRPTLFFFIDPNCEPCDALLPEFEKWQADLAHKLGMVFVSRGGADENVAKFRPAISAPILLQKDRELGERVYARWTPSAILMTADGRIGSHLALGDNAIRKLVDQLAEADMEVHLAGFQGENRNSVPNLIGNQVPEFSLSDLHGRIFGSETFRSKRTLVAFWSPTCPHCGSLMEDIRRWEATKNGSGTEMIIMSDGDPELHRKLAIKTPILIDKGYKTAAKLGISGTPSAVLIDEDARFASETAIGASNIWALIERKMSDA
jgi:uncharacterized membrane protein YphA (DoxX/SURF4 family)/thiol-disulfide isomerase/thioredoxin